MLTKLFSKNVVTASPADTIEGVGRRMARSHVGTVVIVDGQKPVGIITDRDVAVALTTERASLSDPVRQIMSAPVITINWREGILDASQRMRDKAIRRLPIVNDRGKLVGLVSLDDLLVLFGREGFNLAAAITPEVAAAQPELETAHA